MNDADVAKQIQHMVRFIRRETEEKIAVSAEEEFNIEKLQLVETEKNKIRQEYERREKQVEVKLKSERKYPGLTKVYPKWNGGIVGTGEAAGDEGDGYEDWGEVDTLYSGWDE